MSYTNLAPATKLEVRKLQNELQTYIDKGDKLTRSDAKRVDAIIAQLSAIKKGGVADLSEYRDIAVAMADELGLARPDFSTPVNPERRAHEQFFKRFVTGVPDATLEAETRGNDFLAGSATISYSAGSQGGVLVPQSFQQNVAEGLAQIDPLLDENVSTVIQEPGLKLNPLELPGWDLSTIAAVKVDEASQHNSDVAPDVTQKLLNKFTYRLSLGASFEWEEDQRAFDSAMAAMARAFGVGFGRGIGADLVNGDGVTAPAGILNGLSSAYTTGAAGVVSADDIEAVYFGVNRIYRAAKKCAWLMNDAAYKLVRKAKDGAQRPLISVVDDQEQLMGKPVYITPSLSSSGTGSFCVFGDLSHFYVHVTTLYLRRRLQVPGYVERAKALYTGLLSVDSVLHDPTAGVMPPVVAATLHA